VLWFFLNFWYNNKVSDIIKVSKSKQLSKCNRCNLNKDK